MAIHELKTTKKYFFNILEGYKKFELRKNDHDFKVKDFLRLREWDEEALSYTGRVEVKQITYLLEDFPGIEKGYCIMSLK